MKRSLRFSIMIAAVLTVASLLVVLYQSTFETNLHLISSDETRVDKRIETIREILQSSLPISDAYYDIVYSAGALTPGPPSIDACVLLKVSVTSLEEWIQPLEPAALSEVLGDCKARLAGVSGADLSAETGKAFRRPLSAISTREEFVAILSEPGIVFVRISQ